MTKLTLDEIAKRAGVSRTTASRVINDKPHVKGDVRQRVLDVINETGFQPNEVARSLATQKSGVIALVLPRSTESLFTDPYFPRLIRGIAQACNNKDYVLSLFLIQTKEDEEKIYPRIARRGMLDGVIFQVGETGDVVLDKLKRGNLPFVIAGRPANPEGISFVDVDNQNGAFTAVTHLLQCGRKRIATITGPLQSTVAQDRITGYRQALQKGWVDFDQSLLETGDFSEISGFYCMQRLLKQKPDAVFAASDAMAFGALRAIQQYGLRVPEDIALVGYDDLNPATHANPPLTTIRQPVRRFGYKLVEVLLDVINNGSEPARQIIFGTELIIRASCGAAQLAPLSGVQHLEV